MAAPSVNTMIGKDAPLSLENCDRTAESNVALQVSARVPPSGIVLIPNTTKHIFRCPFTRAPARADVDKSTHPGDVLVICPDEGSKPAIDHLGPALLRALPVQMMHSRSLRTLEVCLIALSIVVPCRHSAADVINLAWDPATEQIEEAVGYRIYVGTASGSYSQNIDVGIATTFRFSDAVAGQQSCFAVTAISSASIESAMSNEVCGFSNAPPSLDNPGIPPRRSANRRSSS